MECKRCLFDNSIAQVHNDGECEYCKLHDQLESQSNKADFFPMLRKIRKFKGQYNCLIGISGGIDSSTMLYAAVKHWGLKPLVIHFDNGWNNEAATYNMNKLVEKLGVNSITYKVDAKEYSDLNTSFLTAGLPDADIPNDIAMTKLMYDTADKYGIKYILNGHDFRTEGSTPKGWTYMDAKYIRSVYRWYTKRELKNYPLFTFKDQLIYALKGIKQVRPFHYNAFDREAVEREMKSFINFKEYGGKHCENVYTEFVGAHLLPKEFGIDKRIVYLSALVRSGKITKGYAKTLFSVPPKFDTKKMGHEADTILHTVKHRCKLKREDFDRYNFKRYRPLIWVLAKLKVVPYTFFKKYCL